MASASSICKTRVRCIQLAIENPPHKGERVRIFNQPPINKLTKKGLCREVYQMRFVEGANLKLPPSGTTCTRLV
jgi:hypothetical protein